VAKAFLLSHGARIGNVGDTFVPAGRSIAFYSEFDQNTLRSIGLAAVSAGDIEPTETFGAGEAVSNYYLSRFADNEMAEHLAAESSSSGGTLYFTGGGLLPDPSWLCTTPDACNATYPDHAGSCRGVFKLIGETDIVSVSCRGLMGGSGGNTFEMEGSTEFMDDLQAETIRILNWAATDNEAAMAYYQGLTEATRVMLNGANTNLAAWAQQYFAGGGTDTPAAVIEARNYIESNGDIAFADYADQYDDVQRSVVFADQALLDTYWLGYGRRMLHNDGAPAFWTFFTGVDEYWQNLLSADEELASSMGAGAQGADVAQTSTWAATDADFARARQQNEPFVKDLDEDQDAVWEVGGFVVLLGGADNALASRVRQQPDYATGSFQVERATFGAGSLVFSGVPPMHQGTITDAIEQFSKKDVKFS
jgi:hypothetical protein